ncbi:zinc-dependent alcohol dehydrogenase family protein [Nonomuraea sp. NPDC059023]|uniref:zinc-dependent alcohol dehydrogenase family protein n=1 Tax=unclassified Nonomuraea TaxID=2593643 RepID=UPI003676276F
MGSDTPPVGTMRAWVVDTPGRPLVMEERPIPVPGPGEVLVEVEACALCRTDLHLAEGDLPPRRPRVTPGHQVVGRVRGGDRVGVAWLRSTCGRCRYCLRGDENLCPDSAYTGWDAHGGYAEYVVARADYVYPLPGDVPAERLAPLLCAGIIGYRALMKAGLPESGGRLGIYGFGASAHLTAQAAIALGHTVHVVTRSPAARRLALELGAASAREHEPPEPLEAAILFAPVGDLVPPALEALDRGGTLAVAGIHLTGIPALDYDRHLFQERVLRSVTANTRQDGRSYLRLAGQHPPSVKTTAYSFDEAAQALIELANGQVSGAAVLIIG